MRVPRSNSFTGVEDAVRVAAAAVAVTRPRKTWPVPQSFWLVLDAVLPLVVAGLVVSIVLTMPALAWDNLQPRRATQHEHAATHEQPHGNWTHHEHQQHARHNNVTTPRRRRRRLQQHRTHAEQRWWPSERLPR